MRLLLVEDDVQLAARLGGRLRDAGYAVDIAHTFAEGEAWPDLDKIGAVILDLNLPDGTGMDLLRLWRRRRLACPVIILTARGSWQEKVEGLNAGADDFVVKPVRFEELQARLHAVWRGRQGAAQAWLAHRGLRLDPAAKAAELDGEPLRLSRMEFRLLHLFLRNVGQTLPQGDIIEHLYDLESERQPNAVEVLVGRLRRKIGNGRIETVRGFGYRLLA
ncbi:response regulator transcription factor [Novosphingobium flavum]|uniref:Response regulator transcription factor n=1 Tax=Novosphingobium flavum TaxID=1778672 RepID=A0A7X1FUF9_9SPHN|nr:response regulator transcription factor [Novosphingobium flavum]MBC2667176.1 response regulator transcription factor [Novosphingobium flavum]